MIKIIDPANGWRYGFPKPIPEDVKDVKNGWQKTDTRKRKSSLLENRLYIDAGMKEMMIKK